MRIAIGFLIITASVLIACESPVKSKKRTDNNRIHYTADQKIYFTNVRSLYYQKQTQPGVNIDFYRHRQRWDTDTLPLFQLAIADAWDRDEAYLLLEPNDFFNLKDSIEILWLDTISNMRGKLLYMNGTPLQSTQFAVELGKLMKQPLVLECNGQPFMPEKPRDIYLTTLRDYRKWVNLKD